MGVRAPPMITEPAMTSPLSNVRMQSLGMDRVLEIDPATLPLSQYPCPSGATPERFQPRELKKTARRAEDIWKHQSAEDARMSDIPQGPGWWQASDGKWYPLGQSTLGSLQGERPAVAKAPPKSSDGKVVVLVVLVAAALALYVYGPRYAPQLRGMIGSEGPAEVAGEPSPAAASGQRGPGEPVTAQGQPRELFLAVMSNAWAVTPLAEKQSVCAEVQAMGMDRAAGDLQAGFADELGPLAMMLSTDSAAQFLTLACAEVAAGG